ncbi:LysR family transcriptional regulator [Hyphomicrobiales bacterium BP6-180914]|uniref:LysR family transcriptional regulator n=1 Tax=Lichenifustis flavocetrariae TaxID=2949735 RepID=A0AA41YV05_9HYPH|nr:LysR family transcriptional regulator [Lichenifustis flavocetrariae]MCW6509074.1 LysR family transcriptional regulator [Lichenifustis flavocetrariae]
MIHSPAFDPLEGEPETQAESLLRAGLKFNHLRMMAALDASGQVSTAAHVLNISQPAASRMIAEIEAILQAPICDRLPRGVALTPYGKAFARRARSILLELREAEREIGDLRTGQGGSVFMGTVAAPSITLAVPAIKRIRQRFPKLEINIQVDTSATLASELLASRYDFIIGRIPDDLSPRLFQTRLIGIERACLIVRRGHPLMRHAPVPIEKLTEFDWVFQPSGSLLRRTLEAAFLSRGIALPDRVLNTSSSFLTLVMVAQTDAIAPIAVDVASFVNSPRGLNGAIDVLPVDFEINLQPYSLITARNRALSPAAQMLYDFIVGEAASG